MKDTTFVIFRRASTLTFYHEEWLGSKHSADAFAEANRWISKWRQEGTYVDHRSLRAVMMGGKRLIIGVLH